ncbi:LysM peptidoglycan-binding domain-containing protein [bacterium]|nr:LysM peptidoglycan-binding domain-containing protein [bacterium]
MVVVRKGDTLKSIASRRGLSVAYLKRVNGLKSSMILPGQRLKVSARSYHQNRVHPRKGKRRRI